MKFLDRFKKGSVYVDFLDSKIEQQANSLRIEEMYINHAIDLISTTVGKAEFNFYKKGIHQKDEIDYLLNVRPNNNQISSVFWTNVCRQLLTESEALIIVFQDQLYLADSFETDGKVLKERTYKKIKIQTDDGDSYSLTTKIKASDAIYLNIHSSKQSEVIASFNERYAEMLTIAQRSYKKSNAVKAVLKVPQQVPQMSDADGNIIDTKDYINKIAGAVISDEDSIMDIGGGFNLEVLDTKVKGTTDAFSNLKSDLGNDIALSYKIPLDIFYGTKTEKSQGNDDFINFAISPLIRLIENGLIAGLITRDDYISGERISANKASLQYSNILNIASSVDKLRSIGYSFNDIQRYTGAPEIEENWANKRFITKNYMDVEDADSLKGGD